jgi:hypothetical protein
MQQQRQPWSPYSLFDADFVLKYEFSGNTREWRIRKSLFGFWFDKKRKGKQKSFFWSGLR